MSIFSAFRVAGSALTAQSIRLNAVASNLANAESVVSSDGRPYRARQVVFSATPIGSPAALGVRVSQLVEDGSPARLVYDPRNPAADDRGYVAMPNVNVVEEMTNMISAARSYQNNVEVMNTARQLLLKTLTLGQ
ncbi:flagellar basal body rod protein FlgC [Accumulibacter sp.]|uniref:flagellar basal body rod protein FlgC n=1 Tax=Accumulibacter sp. TaxID=2053492 RepID=UPI0025E6971C|nr:flagellar basal body rod protein FlgC [Accumulibacter sp.]MCM8596237.1 flagellar basal body rod protein FlgC [Accumulibacter sp.]MCM8627168.1 flagellar basal body rod protein FlgC [Accumulibacter sp.]MDS4050386.1 flagellar basal body rod protein FlgC [Accumulibacter sp.]